jgi:trafficking protein particle complex subunit 12
MASAASPPSPPPATDFTASGLPDLSVPYDLAIRGQWQALLSHLSHPSHAPHPHPHHRFLLSALSALSLAKTRRFPDAAALLASLHPDPPCPPPPFLIRLLHAILPLFIPDRPLALDRLYTLLSSVRARPDSGHPEWRRRDVLVASLLVADHLAHREFDVAFALLADIAAREPDNSVLLSRLAYAHLQIGNLTAASATFRHVESVAAAAADPAQYANLLARNRALECIVGKDYAAAVREYENCIEADPADAVALNNKAMCLMYSRDLGDAIKVLEGALERVPTAALNETVVVNLCSMYELAYVSHGEVKRSLAEWIARVAPDDFDTSCTRM